MDLDRIEKGAILTTYADGYVSYGPRRVLQKESLAKGVLFVYRAPVDPRAREVCSNPSALAPDEASASLAGSTSKSLGRAPRLFDLLRT